MLEEREIRDRNKQVEELDDQIEVGLSRLKAALLDQGEDRIRRSHVNLENLHQQKDRIQLEIQLLSEGLITTPEFVPVGELDESELQAELKSRRAEVATLFTQAQNNNDVARIFNLVINRKLKLEEEISRRRNEATAAATA